VIIGLYYGWFILAASSNRVVENLSRYIPGWLATLIWASLLIIIPIGEGPIGISENVQAYLGGLFFIICLFLPIAVRCYPVTCVSILGLDLIERFLLMPLWKARWNRDIGPRL
jgi:hypothetical protein